MGNFVKSLSDRACLVASDTTWVEDAAIAQLITTSQLEGMHRVAGMPDLHPGRGYPVGAAFFSTHVFYPALVGNDIGCGMGLWQTDLRARAIKLDKLEKRVEGAHIHGESGWLHRKGATPSNQGPVVIPGSRGDYSYRNYPTLCCAKDGVSRGA